METAHTDKNFEQKLNHLTDNLIKMSNIVEKQIEIAVNVIKSKDSSDAQTTQNLDEQVDEVERDVRDLSFEIMTLHRPVASDLRLVFTALKVSKELERMGDHSRNLAKRAISISSSFDEDLTDQMHNLGKGVQKMVNQTLESFFKKDEVQARISWNQDAEIDRQYKSLLSDLIERMHNKETSVVDEGTKPILIAKSLERIGDHATNIAEEVIFNITGHYIDLKKSDLE
jgi:phosphate transport system protein